VRGRTDADLTSLGGVGFVLVEVRLGRHWRRAATALPAGSSAILALRRSAATSFMAEG
jgi:hypothetical protein